MARGRVHGDISAEYAAASDSFFRQLIGYTLPPRPGTVIASLGSSRYTVHTDDTTENAVTAYALNDLVFAVNDIVYILVAANAPDTGIILGGKGNSAGTLDHGLLTGRDDDDHTQYILEDGSRAFSGDIDVGGNDVTNVGTVDGRDVSADGSTLDAHVAATAAHGATGAVVGTTNAQTLTNKTLTAPVLSGTVTGAYTLGGTPTFPASVVLTTATQTLTNKTLTAPVLSGSTTAQNDSSSTTGNQIVALVNNDTTTNNYATISFITTDTSADPDNAARIGVQFVGRSATGVSGEIVFQVANDADNPTEVMRIGKSGNVGIGTTSPDGRLHVHAASAGGSVAANSLANTVVVENSANAGISILNTDSSVGRLVFGSPADDLAAQVNFNHSTSLMSVGTATSGGETRILVDSSVEAARFDSSGLMGLGVAAPQGVVHSHDGTGGSLTVSKAAVGPTAQTVIPNGTGDVVHYIRISFVSRHSAGGLFAATVDRAPGAGAVVLHTTGGNDLSAIFNADGSVQLQRTAGVGSFSVQMHAIWL